MRVFVTGATGFIGSAIVDDLIRRGHDVSGLARSDHSAGLLAGRGVDVVRGHVGDVALLTRVVAEHDAVVHAAFGHDDWNALQQAFVEEHTAVSAMLSALAGTDKPFVYTSGSGVLADTGPVERDEAATLGDAPLMVTRIRTERAVIDAAATGVRTIVIRPGLVYGSGGGGTMQLLVELARRPGGPYTVGDGWNVWSAVHRDDLAELFALALEDGPAGSLFHAANPDRTSMREIVAAASRAAGRFTPVQQLSVADARSVAGDMADGLVAEKRLDASHARTVLGWVPRAPSIVDDVERGSYADGDAEATDTAITLINAFEVPGEVRERFLGDWLTDLEFMRRQPGFVEGTLYASVSDAAHFGYVNVAQWARSADFEAAQAGMMQRFADDAIDRVGDWTAMGVHMTPATFTVAKRFRAEPSEVTGQVDTT